MQPEPQDQMDVEVVYARPDVQKVIAVKVAKGSTVRAAIERSRMLDVFPEIDLAMNKVGIYGEVRSLGDTLQAGDRVEIYRALLIDPKEARRQNARLGAEAAAGRKSK